jgi:hypothetical protein
VSARGERSGLLGALLLTLTLLLPPLLVSCSGGGDPRAVLEPSRGFILISLDTVTAEHLSFYGYGRPTTPFLDSLAERSIVFDNAYVQLPGTLPSHMSMFTGLYPDQHDVFPPEAVLAPEIPTLPEFFRRAGFRTIGHTDGGYVHGRFGFSRGFDVFDDRRIILWGGGDHSFARGLASLRALAPEERFFLFVHTYAAHDPYNPPRRCRDLFWDGPPPEGAELPTSAVLRAHNSGLAPLSPEVVDYYASQYDAELRCLDDEIGRFFAGLEELRLAGNVTVVITADHGEEFLQHGKMGHEQIYHENLHVPLLAVVPGIAGGRRVPQVVQSIDLAPTLCDLAGIPPPPQIPGRSLVPLLLGRGPNDGGEAFSRAMSGERSLYSLGSDGLLHLVSIERGPIAGQHPVGVARDLRLWVPPGDLVLEAQSFLEPAAMRVELDLVEVAQVPLRPDRWTRHVVGVADDGGSHFLRLSADTCQPKPTSVGKGAQRCLSFLVRGLPSSRTELYRTDLDRRESRDLSLELRPQRDALEQSLESYRFEPLSAASAEPLEHDVEEQLRALGYLH